MSSNDKRSGQSSLTPLPSLQPLAFSPFADPEPKPERPPICPIFDPYPIELAACQAVGIPHPNDIATGVVDDLHHHIGTFRIADSEGATKAAIWVFRKDVFNQFLAYADYENAIRKIDSVFKKYRAERTDLENELCSRFSRGRHTPDFQGYVTYVGDIAPEFRELLVRPIVVYTPEEPRRTHTYVLGSTGSGKSELLKTLIHSYVCQSDSAAVVVLEPKGDLVQQVAHWPEFIGTNRLVYLKPDLRSGYVPTINPFEIPGLDPNDTSRRALAKKQVAAQQILGALEGIMSGTAGSHLTINMRTILMACILVLLDKPDASLRDLQRFMAPGESEDLISFGASRVHYEDVAKLFQGPFRSDSFGRTKQSIYAKLQSFFSFTLFGEMTCGGSTVDLQALIEKRSIILFDLSRGAMGPQAIAAFGRFVIAYIQALAVRRAEEFTRDRLTPIHLIVDECHNYLSSEVENILVESRSLRLYLTLCQQNVGYRMTDQMRDIVTNNTTVKIAGKAEPSHWTKTADQFPVATSDMEALSKSPKKGAFFIRAGSGAEPFRFNTRTDLLDFTHRMEPLSWNIVKGEQIRRFYRSVVEGEEQPKSEPSSGIDNPVRKRKFKLE